MRLMGRDISTANVLAAVGERLFARGIGGLPNAGEVTPEGIEARVDPMSFYVGALGEHADATQGLPLETHREGLSGRAVVLAKTAFRRLGQIFINEALARQVVFNGHVRDSYAQLSSEVMALRAKVAAFEKERLAAEKSRKAMAADGEKALAEVVKKTSALEKAFDADQSRADALEKSLVAEKARSAKALAEEKARVAKLLAEEKEKSAGVEKALAAEKARGVKLIAEEKAKAAAALEKSLADAKEKSAAAVTAQKAKTPARSKVLVTITPVRKPKR